jgi:hypothetical protein
MDERGGERVHVEVEVDVGSDPIGGRIISDDRSERDFSGWLELPQGLQAVRPSPRRLPQTVILDDAQRPHSRSPIIPALRGRFYAAPGA